MEPATRKVRTHPRGEGYRSRTIQTNTCDQGTGADHVSIRICMPGYILIQPILVFVYYNTVELATAEATLVGCDPKLVMKPLERVQQQSARPVVAALV